MVTVAVVGLGYFSQFHLMAWQAHPAAKLIAVADPNTEAVEAASDKFGPAGFTSLAELLDAHRPDIIDLVVPPPAHASLIRQSLGARAVICQKPFCTSLAEAEAITTEAEVVGTPLLIHENFRFQPWHREIKAFLDAGRLGRVFSAQFNLRPGDGRGKDAYLARQPSFQKMKHFLVQETAIHFIDTFRWLFGDITSVYADLRQLNPVLSGEDAGVLILTHAGGTTSVFDGNRLADHIADNPRTTMGEMIVEGEAGALRLDGFGMLHFRPFGTADWQDVPVTASVDHTQFGGGCVAALNSHVIEALKGERALENTAREYLSVVRVCDAAYESDRTGCRISL